MHSSTNDIVPLILLLNYLQKKCPRWLFLEGRRIILKNRSKDYHIDNNNILRCSYQGIISIQSHCENTMAS